MNINTFHILRRPADPDLSVLPREAFYDLAGHVNDRDRPILAMLMAGDHPDEIARRLGMSARALRRRRRMIVARVRPILAARFPASPATEPAPPLRRRTTATPSTRSQRRSGAVALGLRASARPRGRRPGRTVHG